MVTSARERTEAASDAGRVLSGLIRLMRPKQWTKNLIVFAGLVFSGGLRDWSLLGRVLTAFTLFCLVSSSIYIINDTADLERDRCHPKKCQRPLPSGQVSTRQAMILLAVLGLTALLGSLWLSPRFFAVVFAYAALMILYTFYLKNIVIVDVLVISMGFVMRAWSGTAVIDVPISPWLLVCTVLLALFLGFSKRRHELTLLAGSASDHRAILQEYSPELLDQMISVVTATTIMAYCLYTFTASSNHYMMLTIPFVLYGIFRYMYLVHQRDLGGSPELVLVTDIPLLVDITIWGVTAIWVLYFVAL